MAEPGVFVPLYYADKLHVVNPRGRVGFVTLWTRVDYTLEQLAARGVDLSPGTSPIAVVANLYGDGLPQMLANLLHNPQVDVLAVCGKDMSGSRGALSRFFSHGVEAATAKGMVRVRGTNALLPDALRPELFLAPPRLVDLGGSPRELDAGALGAEVEAPRAAPLPERVALELKEPVAETRPSAHLNLNVVADTPCAAWRELLFVASQFGRVNPHGDPDRLELLNVRAVVLDPTPEPDDVLVAHERDPAEVRRYPEQMLDPECPPDSNYTYGNRLKRHFGVDTLARCAELLRAKPGTRDAYVSLWDVRSDYDREETPCLVSLFFRAYEERLTLTATYRAHNLFSAWLKNVYGLMRAQHDVAAQAGLERGPLTVVSHSLSLRRSALQAAAPVIELYRKKRVAQPEDAHGFFVITLEGGKIVVAHRAGGFLLKRYEGTSGRSLERQLAEDRALSEVSHALYLGRELQRAEDCLRAGTEFVQG